MKIYMLDVTGCKEEKLGGYDRPIPCKLSDWKAELDVMEERIDPTIITAWRAHARDILNNASAKTGIWTEVIDQAPIGFDLRTLPVGATITVVEEE